MNTHFSIQEHRDGWYRLTAEMAQKVTFLVCECETLELASYMAQMLNASPKSLQQQIMAS